MVTETQGEPSDSLSGSQGWQRLAEETISVEELFKDRRAFLAQGMPGRYEAVTPIACNQKALFMAMYNMLHPGDTPDRFGHVQTWKDTAVEVLFGPKPSDFSIHDEKATYKDDGEELPFEEERIASLAETFDKEAELKYEMEDSDGKAMIGSDDKLVSVAKTSGFVKGDRLCAGEQMLRLAVEIVDSLDDEWDRIVQNNQAKTSLRILIQHLLMDGAFLVSTGDAKLNGENINHWMTIEQRWGGWLDLFRNEGKEKAGPRTRERVANLAASFEEERASRETVVLTT